MFLEKYARSFFKRKMVVVTVSILLVILLLFKTGYLGEGNKVRIACVGDSLTYGSGVLKTRETNSYPAKLQKKLGNSYKVLNFGLRNATASAQGDLPYLESEEYAQSLESNPDIVILMLGTNDSKISNWDPVEYEAGLRKLLESYIALDNAPTVYLIRSPYCFAVDGSDIAEYTIQPSVVENEIGAIAKTLAEEEGVSFIDLYSVTDGQNELYTSDGIHFNKSGYELFSSTIYQYLLEEIKE